MEWDWGAGVRGDVSCEIEEFGVGDCVLGGGCRGDGDGEDFFAQGGEGGCGFFDFGGEGVGLGFEGLDAQVVGLVGLDWLRLLGFSSLMLD